MFEIENIESQKIEVAAPAVDVQALLRDTLEKESTSHAIAQCGPHASKMIRAGSLKKKSPAMRLPNGDLTRSKLIRVTQGPCTEKIDQRRIKVSPRAATPPPASERPPPPPAQW